MLIFPVTRLTLNISIQSHRLQGQSSCLFIAICQVLDGGAHEPAGILVAGADPLRALNQVVFGGHAA